MDRRLLTCYPLFRLLSPQQLDDWIASGQEVASPTGETLFQENTPGAWVYLVRDGRVRVLRQSGPREITLGTLVPGDVFGEYALLPPGRNTATCRTAAPSRLLCLPLAPLKAAVQQHLPVWRNLKNWLRLHTLLHFHRQRAFLGFMSAESSLKLLDRLRPALFPAGHTIQADGLAADRWFVIDEGTVALRQSRPGADGGSLSAGETFGEPALARAGEVPTATALTDVRASALALEDFDPAAHSQLAQSYQPRTPGRPGAHVWVPQLEVADCGLAALVMVASRLGVRVGVEELRTKAAPGPGGLTGQRLLDLATEIGLACQCVRVSADRLGQVRLPAIAHLSGGHYVALHELTPHGVVVGDPAAGIVTWSLDYLAQHCSGALLLFGGLPAAPARPGEVPGEVNEASG